MVSIESPYATSYWWLTVTGILGGLPRTVSEWSQLTVQILDTFRFKATLWGLRNNVRCSLGLTGKRVLDFPLVLIELFSLGITAEELRAMIGSKSAISTPTGACLIDPEFQVEGIAPHQPFFLRKLG